VKGLPELRLFPAGGNRRVSEVESDKQVEKRIEEKRVFDSLIELKLKLKLKLQG